MPRTTRAAGTEGVHFDADELVALRRHASRLHAIAPRTRTRRTLTGAHLARMRGRGMEYVESRPYMPGDDVRTIDWRVTARSGRAHTKLFQEERERPVSLVVDFSPSMFFGTRVAFKSVIAARAAALVAWSVIARGDRIGALVGTGERHLEVRPAGGRRGALGVIRALVALGNDMPETMGRATLAETLLRARRVLRPGSLIVVLSDFYGLDDEAVRHLSRLRSHDEVIACWVHDPIEVMPPPPGRYPVSDGRERSILDTGSAEVLEAYLDHVESFRTRIQEVCGRLSLPLITLPTDGDVASGIARGIAAWSPVDDLAPARSP